MLKNVKVDAPENRMFILRGHEVSMSSPAPLLPVCLYWQRAQHYLGFHCVTINSDFVIVWLL